MPGTTSQSIPACASASASSPPRPKMNGSPPFSRTTHGQPAAKLDQQRVDLLLGERVVIRRACRRRCAPRTARRERHDPGVGQRGRRPARRSAPAALAPRTVSRPGSPGPAPTRYTVTTPPTIARCRSPPLDTRRAPPPAPCSRRPAPQPGRARRPRAGAAAAWSSAATSCRPRRLAPAPPALPGRPRARTSAGSNRKPIRAAQAQPHQPGGGQHDRVGLARVELAQARVHVAAQRHHLEVGPQLAQQARRGAPTTCRCGRRRGSRPASRTARSRHRGDRSRSGTAADHEPVGHLAGQILGAVHRHVDAGRPAAPARSRG